MTETFTLVGDFTPTELDQSGLTLVAPGLHGTGTWFTTARADETRALTGEQPELERAIVEAGLEDRHTLRIEAPTPAVAPGGGGRGYGDLADDELLLQVPLARDETALVLYVDEAGVLSFHFPPDAPDSKALPSRAFGAGQQLRFRLRLRPGGSRPGGVGVRGWMGKVAAKVIKVLVVKGLPDQSGGLIAHRVQAWERNHRPPGLHGGTWAQLLDPRPTPVADLAPWVDRQGLLLIHGTTSTTAGAFAGLADQPALLERLQVRYQGRILGFNHHTLGASVADNVRSLYAELARHPGTYRFDILCHSRGGLVARALAHLSAAGIAELTGTAWTPPPGVTVQIGRIVFVATPNAGTPLAEPQRIPAFVERLANVVNLLPDAGLTIASGALLSLAAAAVEVTLPRLPGLVDQAPGSRLQQLLAPPAGGADGFYAFSADYEPQGDLVGVVKDGVMDRIFAQERNDLVVPADGVAETPYFRLPSERVCAYPSERGVHHGAFFRQAEMTQIAQWLA